MFISQLITDDFWKAWCTYSVFFGVLKVSDFLGCFCFWEEAVSQTLSNWLKLSNFFIFKGKCLYNLTAMCNILFWSKGILQDCVWRSYLLLILCSLIPQFCLRSPLYFFMKHRTSKTCIDVTVRILFSLNFCQQDSYFFLPVISLITFLWIWNAFMLPRPPPPNYNTMPESWMKNYMAT